MSESPILEYWPEGIAAARIPANNNVRLLQALLLNPAISATTAAQPGSPAEMDTYILPASPTGAQWDGFNEDDVVIFYNATWTAYAPPQGLLKYVEDEGEEWQFVGSSSGGWVPLSSASAVSSVNGDTGAVIVLVPIQVACSDETTALTTGTAKVTFRMPFAMTLLAGSAGVRASVTTAPTGSVLTVDINESGSTILSTKITIDATEKTSTTAATPPVISDTSLADDAEITIDIDTIGSTIAGTGLKVTLIGYPT
jgi:hypothetical protein